MSRFSQPCHQQLFTLTSAPTESLFQHSPFTILGSIFAVAAAPEIPLPNKWLPWIFKPDITPSQTKQLDEASECAMQCFQWQLNNMRKDKIALASELIFPQPLLAKGPLAEWMQGVLMAHTRLEDVWHDAWKTMLDKGGAEAEKLQKDLQHCLSMFSTFADIPFAIEQAKSKGNTQLEGHLAKIYLSLSGALTLYVQTAGTLVGYLPDQFENYVAPS